MTISSLLRSVASLALAVSLGACGTVTPAGLIAASRLDPLNTPPSDIAMALSVPKTLRLSDGDAELRFAFEGGSEASTILLEEIAPLQLRPSPEGGPRSSVADDQVYVARIAPEDAPAIAALQSEILALRAAGLQGEGSLTIRVIGGCFVDAAPPSIAISTWLQTDASDGFVQLTRRQDISRAIGARDAALLRSQLRPCPE